MNKVLSPQVKIVLIEMCHRVGANFQEIDFQAHGWFWEHTWTKEEEKSFIDWLTEHLYNNKAARDEFCSWPRKNKKHLKRIAESFIWNHGWKVKDE